MFILVGFLQWIIGFVFQPTGRFWSFLYVALIGTIGGGLYGVMCLYTRLLDKVIGQEKQSVTSTIKIIIIVYK